MTLESLIARLPLPNAALSRDELMRLAQAEKLGIVRREVVDKRIIWKAVRK